MPAAGTKPHLLQAKNFNEHEHTYDKVGDDGTGTPTKFDVQSSIEEPRVVCINLLAEAFSMCIQVQVKMLDHHTAATQ